LVRGCSSSAATAFSNSTAVLEARNSSMLGTHNSTPGFLAFLKTRGSPKFFTVLSMLMHLKGDDLHDPEIPTTFSAFPVSSKMKQWWMHLTRFPPAGIIRKFPSG
jgi:hypothetical protein